MTEINLKLTGIAPTGEAIGRADGLVLFVPFGLPGETVSVEIEHQRRNFGRARLVKVITPAPERVQPPCPHFGRCGGCQWQHIDYAAQITFKTNIVREQLERMGKFENPIVRDCLPSPVQFGYRNRIQLARSLKGKLGYLAERTHNVIEIEDCPIADPIINQALHDERILAIDVEDNIDLRIGTLMPDSENLQVSVNGKDTLYMSFEGLPFRVSAGAFAQVNTAVAEMLMREVLHAANVQSHERVLDLYCGGGLFTWPLALRCAQIVGVESSRVAVADARHNMEGLKQVSIIEGDVMDVLATPAIQANAWDLVVLDPPRAGVDRPALERLARLKAARIVYVSCDAATLARDGKYLREQGYTLVQAQPMDMFPQTHHVETVAIFQRSS